MTNKVKQCSYKDCTEEATFPAPCNPHDLGERQYFCQAHIKEFNKKWNGLDGFSEDDIFAMQTDTWVRPTWKMGMNADNKVKSEFEFASADDLFSFFKERRNADGIHYSQSSIMLPPDVKEACVIFNMEPPFEKTKLKKNYLSLIKKHHPDVNAGNQTAEDHVKRINVAYQILKDYSEKTA